MKLLKKVLTPFIVIVILLTTLTMLRNMKSGTTATTKGQVNIGVFQFADHPSLDAARKGFLKALKEGGYVEGKNVTVDYQNAHGSQADVNSIAQQSLHKNDLVLGIATPSAISLAANEPKVPVLFTAVTDPVASKIVKSIEKPGGMVTGTSDQVPVEKLIPLMKKALPSVKTVGILFTSSEPNSIIQKKEAAKILKKEGYTVVEQGIVNTNDVQSSVQTLMGQVDAVFVPTDNTISSTMATVKDVSLQTKIPVFGGSTDMVDIGGVFTYGTNYEALGEQTGQMAVKILKGQKPAVMPVEYAKNLEIHVNEELAKQLGVDVSGLK